MTWVQVLLLLRSSTHTHTHPPPKFDMEPENDDFPSLVRNLLFFFGGGAEILVAEIQVKPC